VSPTDPQDCTDVISLDRVIGVGSLLPATKLAKLTKLGKHSDEAAGATSCLAKHSFLTGTDVLLADGTTKDIEDVETGDKVVVTDPETGKTTTREVVATIVTEDDKDFVDLTVTTEDGPASLVSTTTHPFWVESEEKWVDAGELVPGMALRAPDGATVTVEEVRAFTKRQRTHDLTVNDIHTYYVLAGATPVLVHNSNGCPTIDDSHIVNNRMPEGMFSSDRSKTEWLPEASQASCAAFINDVLKRGRVVKDTQNRDGIVREFTYEEPVGYARDRNRTPLYTLRVYYDPDLNHVRNAFPVR